jgi:putative phosphoribosyl transferase
MLFKDRVDAGRQLAERLLKYRDDPFVVVIGLPRGGVVVAAEVARELRAPLDIVVPRKIGAPGNPELALGALTEEGDAVFHEWLVDSLGVSEEYLSMTLLKEKREAQRRLEIYRGKKPPLHLQNKTALLVDDGIATGATMRAAILSCRGKGAVKIVVSAPVIARDTLEMLEGEGDEVICVDVPEYFVSVGQFYETFEQTPDEEVVALLRKNH